MKRLLLGLLLWLAAVPALAQSGTPGVPLYVSTNTDIPTYSVGADVSNASAGLLTCLYGSSTKTIKIKNLQISGVATAAASVDIDLTRYTGQPSGGGLANPTIGLNDPGNAAATATVMTFTSNPTTGTAVARIRDRYINVGTSTSAVTTNTDFDFARFNDQSVVLRGVNDGLCATIPALTGGSWALSWEWTEQ